MKDCAKCGHTKPVSDFPAHKKTKSGLCSWCRECHAAATKSYRNNNKEKVAKAAHDRRKNDPEKFSAIDKKQYEKHKTKVRFSTIRRKYGLTEEEYYRLLEEQNGECAICFKPSKENVSGWLYVDHCHTTGIIRGLLCMQCNALLGKAKDSVDILLNSIAYLERNYAKEKTEAD